MQPVKITIPGAYWDSQIYSGRLYLFGVDGSIDVINWDRAVEALGINDDLRLAAMCAFSRSDYLYGSNFKPIFDDPEIFPIIESKFSRLGSSGIELSLEGLQYGHEYISSDNKFPFPHTDTKIYSREIFVSSQSGVWKAPCHKQLKYNIGQRPVEYWDAPVLGMSAFGGALAMASGGDGLFESQIGDPSWYYSDYDTGSNDGFRQITTRHCTSCEWTFSSIFGSSHVGGGFLAEFEVDYAQNGKLPAQDPDKSYESSAYYDRVQRPRRFQGIRKASDLFDGGGYAWAFRDKMYQASAGVIKVLRFQPWKDRVEEEIEYIGQVQLQSWKGNLVSAGVAVFGSVVELDNAIVVIASDDSVHTIPEEPVRWRVFPRSKHYENQLHIVYDNRLDIYSFNQDYFVDQSKKKMGVKPYL